MQVMGAKELKDRGERKCKGRMAKGSSQERAFEAFFNFIFWVPKFTSFFFFACNYKTSINIRPKADVAGWYLLYNP